MAQLNYWWDTWGGSSYGTPEAILSNTCSYEISTSASNENRGLKTESDLYVQNPSDSTTFSLDHSELFGYDSNTDYRGMSAGTALASMFTKVLYGKGWSSPRLPPKPLGNK